VLIAEIQALLQLEGESERLEEREQCNRPADRAWTEPIPESGWFVWTAEQRSVVGYRFGTLKG
jgi:hypothetical protein